MSRSNMPQRMITAGGFLFGVAAGLACSAALAATPYRPADDGEVLEKLPVALLSGVDELTTLRRRLADDPANAELATDVASRCVRLGKQSGEPRFYGYARAALRPWWDAPDAPAELLALRAKLKERDHRYRDALADLDRILQQEPDNVQAWVETANINRVLGDYGEAWRACDRLEELVDPLTILIPRVPLMAATGRSQQAYEALGRIAPRAEERWPEAVDWILTMQAEVARGLGRDIEAEQHFLDGLARNPGNQYLLRSYADLLLDQNREREAIALLEGHTNDTGVLLRAAIAARRSGDEERARQWRSQLERRFKELRLRGDRPHGRFESRYWLQLRNDPKRALAVGLENWSKQKETRDTRNVLEAAVAAGAPEAVRPVLEFLAKHGVDHTRLVALAEEIKAKP